MANDDFSGVTAFFNAASYTAGQTMTLTVIGQNKHTSDGSTATETVTVTAQLQATGGATTSITGGGPVTVTRTTPGAVTMEEVTIVSITDSGGRTWTVNGRNATAIA